MVYNILVFMSFFQSIIGFVLMTSSVMRFKEPFKKRVIVGFSVMFFGIIFLSYLLFLGAFDLVNSLAIFIILAIQLSWFLICGDDRFFVSLFSFLTFANVYVLISYVSDNLAVHIEGKAFILERIIIRTIIYLIILPLLFKFVRPAFRRLEETLEKEWKPATLVPFMFLIMQIMVLYYPNPYWLWNNRSWSRFIIATLYILFLAVYYLLYIQANGIVEKYVLEKRQLIIAQQEKLWESELIRQKVSTALASQQRHDMHHHNTVIIGLLQSGDIEKLKTYMEKFDHILDAHSKQSFCSNPIANSIFNAYAIRAEKEGIKIEFNISVPENIGIDNIDLTCVLGNGLENAIEACLRLPKDIEREIILTVKFIDNRLRVQIENTSLEDITFEGDLPITKKQGGGIGAKSIIYTAERYDGTAGFSLVDGKFITQIVLNAK